MALLLLALNDFDNKFTTMYVVEFSQLSYSGDNRSASNNRPVTIRCQVAVRLLNLRPWIDLNLNSGKVLP